MAVSLNNITVLYEHFKIFRENRDMAVCFNKITVVYEHIIVYREVVYGCIFESNE